MKNKNKKPLPVWLWLAGIIVLTVIAYLPAFNNGFLNWDDTMYVTGNGLIRSLSAESIFTFFKTLQVQGNYHPLTLLSLALDYRLFGLNPTGYHTINIIVHLLNVCLVFAVMQKLFKSAFITVFVSLLFAIHPMHVESVAWVSERKDVLYTLFYLSGMWCYITYLDKKKPVFFVYTIACFVLSLLSKAQAVTFPLALLIVDYIRNGKLPGKVILAKVPLLLASLAFGIVAIYAQQSLNALYVVKGYSLTTRLLLSGYALAVYCIKFLVPVKLAADYPYPQTSNGWFNILVYLSLLIPVVFAAAILLLRNYRVVISGLLFFLITIAPVLKVLTVGDALVAERYTYLSYLGLFWALAYGINYAIQKIPKLKPVILIGCCGYVIFLAYSCYGRTQVWQNDQTLWSDELAQFTDVPAAWGNLGNFYLAAHNIEGAKNCFSRSITANDNNTTANAIALSDRSYTYYLLGQFDSSIADADKALELQPANKDAHQNRSVSFVATGKTDSALMDDNWMIAHYPTDTTAHFNHGYAELYAQHYDSALADFNWAISHCPHNSESYAMHGCANTQLNRWDDALADFNKALSINPYDWATYGNRSYVYLEKGNNEEAAEDATIAIENLHDANLKNFTINRARAYRNLDEYDKALQDYLVLQKMGIAIPDTLLLSLREKIAGK